MKFVEEFSDGKNQGIHKYFLCAILFSWNFNFVGSIKYAVEDGANENKGSLFTPGICHGPGQCLFKDHIFLFLDQNRTWLILNNDCALRIATQKQKIQL
jgi:hypothetical protein